MKKIFLILISVGLFLYTALIFGQVTIGADKEPEDFAILELVSSQRGGLRLPQMTTHKRDSITNSTGFKTNTLARGLQIFNTTSLCVETWNGTQWIPTCNGAETINADNGLTKNNNTVELGGMLNNEETYIIATAFTKLILNGNGNKSIWIDGIGAGAATISAPLAITSGYPANGKVLTSDAQGNATWQPLPIAASGLIDANNGLTRNGDAVQLGGTLNKTTEIAQAGYNFYTTGSGKVSIGAVPTAGSSKFEVNGASTNMKSFSTSGLSIDFTQSNLACTTASAGTFTLTGLKDGGTYTLAVKGETSGTASFAQAGITFHLVNNGATTASKHTLYTFVVMGNDAYVWMTKGF
ncbi:MAG: hypothetical protein LBB53_03635 [Prevotellaceae bacterium]|jgi:hypothetical protein|nr:hypothetical protein [Prevotellaceae bacterium]